MCLLGGSLANVDELRDRVEVAALSLEIALLGQEPLVVAGVDRTVSDKLREVMSALEAITARSERRFHERSRVDRPAEEAGALEHAVQAPSGPRVCVLHPVLTPVGERLCEATHERAVGAVEELGVPIPMGGNHGAVGPQDASDLAHQRSTRGGCW